MKAVFEGHWKYILLWSLITLFWWAFAFFPINPVDTEWLLRARVVCFGMSDSGLPNSGGWLLLGLGPISLLVVLWVIMGQEIKDDFKAQRVGQVRKQIVLISFLLMALQVAWASSKTAKILQQEKALKSYEALDAIGGLPENYTRINKAAPLFQLVDQFGKTQTLKDFEGKVVLVVFAFAHCSAVCPTLVHTANAALEKIENPNMRAIFITLDPERDTPSSLPTLARQWKLKKNSYVLSGSAVEVHRVLDAFNLPRTKDEKTGDVTHPAVVALIDQKGKIAYYFNNPTQQWIIDGTTKLFNEQEH